MSAMVNHDETVLDEACEDEFKAKNGADRKKERRNASCDIEITKIQDPTAILARAAGQVFHKKYTGDVFGTRTESIDGLVYLSRIRINDKPKQSLVHVDPKSNHANAKLHDVGHLHVHDAAYRAKKRQCAKTFEKMVFARLPTNMNTTTAKEDNAGIKSLLDNGIILALINLTEIPDIQTQLYCAKAFYGLSQVHATRRLMVLNGIIQTISHIIRHDFKNASLQLKLKQDYAAVLCHLTEEVFLEEKMLHEGADRILAKLFQSHNTETKRIVALAYFNLSYNTSQLKHYSDGFVQSISAACKSINHLHHITTSTLYLLKALFNLTQNTAFHGVLMAESVHRFLALPLIHYHKVHFQKRETQMYENEAIKIGLLGLFSLSMVKSGRLHIVQDNLVQYIVDCLSLDNDQIPDTVCSILYQLSMDEACRDAMVHEMKFIVACIPKSSPFGYFAFSWVFRNLCACKTIYPALVESGVIPVLMNMSRHSHEEIKLNGISCVCCFLQSDLHLNNAAECLGYILNDLVGLTASPFDAIVIFAISALFNLSCNDSLQPLLCDPQVGLVLALKFLVVTNLSKTQANKAIVAALMPLLYRLSCNPDCRLAMVQAGFFDFVAAAIPNTASSIRQAALDTMLNFSMEEDYFPQGADEVKALLKALYVLKTNHDMNALRSCVSLLTHLTTAPKNLDLLLKTGCVLCLERMCNSADDFIMANCAHILYCLTESSEAVDRILREGAIPVLIQLSRASSDHVKHLCIMTFCRISSFVGLNVETKLVDQGAIAAVMIMALVASKSDKIKTVCVQIISNCLCIQSKRCTKAMVDHGVFWALSSLSTLSLPETKLVCATCFCNTSIAYPLKMIEAGVPRALVHLVESGDTNTIVVALQAIVNLVNNDKACTILVNEGIIRLLRTLVEHKSTPIWHAATVALLKITRIDEKCRVDNVRNGLLPWIQSILSDVSIAMQSLVALCAISSHEISRKHMSALDTISILYTSYQLPFTGDEAIETCALRTNLCLQILYNVSCESSFLHDLIKGGAHGFIQNCLNDVAESVDLQNLCIGVLHNLTCVGDDEALANLVTTGATNLLETLHNIEALAPVDQLWCVLAICNLALGKVNTTRMVADNGGVVLIDFARIFSKAFSMPQDITKLFVQHIVSAAIRKIVTPPGNQKIMLELGVVASIVDLLNNSDDDQIRINCLESLTDLTRNKEHVERCLHDGLLACVLEIADVLEDRAWPGVGTLCFSIISNVCAVDFDDFHLPPLQHPSSANVISYLTKLSEYTTSSSSSHSTTFYHREDSDEAALPLPPLHTTSILSSPTLHPSTSAHLNVVYTVPWVKSHHPSRPELPAAIPTSMTPINIAIFTKTLPDSFQVPHPDILPKEPLVRDATDASEHSTYVYCL
ncbi:hypothetical protein THRCLA_00554 [Thraustotheca clavata]|uniref:Uncharacterized protein n=1 Tax=Thraustotheca clavata TaxID=74557 RepID=A0A1W0AB73_9STRA|nr:hypothetical protein THRCLA_00554 [Thraustotheca clavata]